MADSKFTLHTTLVQSASEIEEIAKKLRSEKIIAFDTEFIRESTFYPRLEIIQVASKTEGWLIDAQPMQTNPDEKESLNPILEIFEDPKIIKVVHAALGDQECLYSAFGMVAINIFDTAVAASLCGMGDGIGLANLLKIEMNVKLKKGHARTNWSQRPLPKQLADYALSDVEFLVDLGEKLHQKLDSMNRLDWAFELSSKMEDTNLFETQPDEIAQRLFRSGKIQPNDYGILLKLVEWREARVRELDIPRKWLSSDSVLLDIARVQPKSVGDLKNFRGLNKGELKKNGNEILNQIKLGKESGIKPPERKRMTPPSSHEARAMDLLKCYLGLLADENQIASRHLLAPDQFIKLFRSEVEDPNVLVEQGILSRGAANLVGKEMIEFIAGNVGLTLSQKRVKTLLSKGE